MTPEEWKQIQVGDVLVYTVLVMYSNYADTVCEVVNKDSSFSLTLKILRPGRLGYTTWGNDSHTAEGWDLDLAHKFTLKTKTDNPLNTLEKRIEHKIKSLDQRWAHTQSKKGNTYALLLLR